jgi:hypothetical protein
VRIELGTEIEIVVPQTLERIEIVVMIDGGKACANLPEFFPLTFAHKRPVADKGIEQIGLADGNELLAPDSPAGRVSERVHCEL